MSLASKERNLDIKDSAQYKIVLEKVLASIDKTMKLIPKSMIKLNRDNIRYKAMSRIQKVIQEDNEKSI